MFRRKKSKDKTTSPRRTSMTEEEVIQNMWATPDAGVLSRLQETDGRIDAKDMTICANLFLKKNGDYCQQFAENIIPKLNNKQLFNLTESLMQGYIANKQNEPLLRCTDLLSGTCYVELANRCDYDPLDQEKNSIPMMDVLNHYVFKSVCDVMGLNTESTDEIAMRDGSVASVIIVKLGADEFDNAGKLTPELAKKLVEIEQRNRELGQGKRPDITEPLINARVTGEKPPKLPHDYDYAEKPWSQPQVSTKFQGTTERKFSIGGQRKKSADEGQTKPKKPSLEKNPSVMFTRRQPSTEGQDGPKEPLIGRRRGPSQGSESSE